jgi:hypothetical protein
MVRYIVPINDEEEKIIMPDYLIEREVRGKLEIYDNLSGSGRSLYQDMKDFGTRVKESFLEFLAGFSFKIQ